MTKMLQITYELLQGLPPILLCGLIFLSYVFYIGCPCWKCRGWQESRQALKRKLTSLSLKILFEHESLAEVKEKVEMSMLKANLRVVLDALFSSLPLMLVWMAFTVFWNRFLIYEIDHGCSINDPYLECFSNSSGPPLSCSDVRELINSTYRCYKFSFDIVNAAAAAGGMFTVAVLFNVILVKCFVCFRYITDSPKATMLFQCFMAFCIVATELVFCVFLKYILLHITDFEKIMQIVTIFLCSSFCCLYPWYVVEPSRDNDFAWIPCRCHKKREYESINGENEELTVRASRC